MNIAIIGYGKMGHEIERLAKERNVVVSSIIDPYANSATHTEITKEALNEEVDVVIDFSSANAVVENVRKVSSLGKDIVIGTTGWYDALDEVRKIVAKKNTGLIYSPNFSLGVNLFLSIVETASKLFNKFKDYDVFIYENHHNQKSDSPSGTAKKLAEIVLKGIERKKKTVFERIEEKIKPEELHVVSLRAGYIPGTHVVGFDSEEDTIELKHTARNRRGFAVGALTAAEWVIGKKGFFTMRDLVGDMLL